MAIDPKSLTVDYRTLQAIPFRDRRALLYSSYADQINSALTPGQRANLFPSYYQRDAAAAKSALTGASGMLGGSGAANRERTGAGVGFSDSNTVEGQPEKKGPPAITASEFRSVESNPFLAGYADKTVRKTANSSGIGPSKNASAIQKGIINLANKFGMDPVDVATFMRYETAGTLDPYVKGLKTKWGVHRGLIQMGDYQQKQYGINLDPNKGPVSTIEEQFVAIDKYFEEAKFYKWLKDNPNATIHQKRLAMYASVNAGSPYEVEATDAHNGGAPGTVIDKVNDMFDIREGSHYNLAKKYMAESMETVAEQTTTPDAMSVVQEVASQTVSAAELVEKDKSVVSEQSLVDEAQETATARKEPITPELKEVLQYAAEESGSGIEVEVFSGGQMSKAEALSKGGSLVEIEGKKYWKLPNGEIVGTGSVRHNDGHAADIRLKVKDENGNYRYLSARNKEDRKIMSDFIKSARKYGAQGIGSGEGYMGDTGIHVGTVRRPDLDYTNKEYGAPKGAEAIWDSDAWARQAFAEGQKEAEIFEKSGGMIALRKQREEKIAKQKEADQQKLAEETEVQKEQPVSKVTFTEESGASLLPESHPFSMTKEKKERIKAAQTQTAAAVVEEPQTATTTEEPQSQTTPIKTMAQGGIVPSYGESEIVTRAPTSGEVIQRTKISEYGAEQVKVEPISKMKAEALTPVKNDLDVAPQMNEDQQKPPMQKASMTASRISNRPYSNIMSEVKKPTATALRAALQIRMGNTAMGDYVA